MHALLETCEKSRLAANDYRCNSEEIDAVVTFNRRHFVPCTAWAARILASSYARATPIISPWLHASLGRSQRIPPASN
jgi:hypothetical protein